MIKYTYLPESWATATLSEIANINPRLDKSGIDDDLEVSFVPMPAVETESGEIDVSKTRRFVEVKKGYTPFQKNDVLFAKITPCMENGKMAVVPDLQNNLGFGSTEFHVLRPCNSIEPKFVYHYVSSQAFRNDAEHNMTGAVGQRRVPTSYLEQHSFPLPPYNEQKRIVAKIEELLSELDNGIKCLKTAREQLKIYRQAVLKHAFEGKLTADWREQNQGKLEPADRLLESIKRQREESYQQRLKAWRNGENSTSPHKTVELEPLQSAELQVLPQIPQEWKYVRLAEIAAIGSGMSVSKNRKLNDPIEVPYLRVANVQRGKLILDEIKTMMIEKSKLIELELSYGDVLFNEGGDRDKLGRGWIWESQIKPCITQNHVFRATTILGLDFHAKFISHWGNTFGQVYFDEEGKQTTNLASINKDVLSHFPVPLPSIEEQKKILEVIEYQLTVINKFETDIELALNNSEALRQSILKKAFCGKLVEQDTSDEPASVLLERIRAEKGSYLIKNKSKHQKDANSNNEYAQDYLIAEAAV